MNIVILGADEIGSYVASVLANEEHNVTVVDSDLHLLEKLSRESDVATLHALEPSWRLFNDLLEFSPHLFFAATNDDETNLVSCAIAKNLGFPKTIARVRSRDYLHHKKLDFGRLFFVDHFVAPELMVAQDLFKKLIHTGDLAVEHFAHGAIQMRTVQIPEKWNKGEIPIRNLKLPDDLIVGLIRRRGEKTLFPHGDDHILPGDEATVVGEAKIMHHLHEIFHSPTHPVRSVILVGGSPTAFHLAHLLLDQKVNVRIIDSDSARCQELAERLPQATIIHRDAKDPQLLRSESVQDADALVSCTGQGGANFMIAALAKELGCPKSIALIHDPAYGPVLEKAGVIPAFSAHVNIANRVLSILNEKTVISISSLGCDMAKIVELKVSASSKLIGIPLAHLSSYLPKDLLIAVIESQGRVMIGKGNRTLCPDDTVIAICHSHQIPQLQQLFH